MSHFITIAGIVFLVLLAAALAIGAYAWAVAVLDAWESKRYARRYTVAVKEIGFRLVSASRWLPESSDAQKAIHDIGDHMMRNGTLSIDQIREEWRKNTGRKP